MTANTSPQETVSDLMEKGATLARQQDEVCMSDIVDTLGKQVLLPMLLFPALAVVTPLSGIPGLSSVCGIIIALVSLQLLRGRDTLWLPDWILRRKISSDRLEKAVNGLNGVARWLDKISRPRLQVLVRAPGSILPEFLCFLSGSAMPFLELVPFSSSVLGGATSLFAVGLVMRDGLFIMAGFALVAMASGLAVAVTGLLI
ncbi:hypothetical protein EDD53_1535 [Pacificibacter maritimus]|uniref:Exopolysaccharide synthesis protein ExoD n=1 Tax=Pacificibacter maritimus TaxID=762213 RepID=A0A3N4UII4_9RHOB|nr:exopolysaccharide biosynthesis protein [Pacificibacter maritimus]RPE67131.1 hypothetical protein EDD53_1535 [Pacificibacter maritimus]